MESCVMPKPPKLHVTFWGVTVNAEGALAIGAAFLIIMSLLAFYRF
jgi:hypothetical protein